MRQGDEALHERRPFETGVTRDVNKVRDDLLTSVRRTLNPAHTLTPVSLSDVPPAVVEVRRYNVRGLPLGKLRIVHDVPVVTQECRPSREDS